ncbi:hypothetical protein ACI8B_180305 [Acinetobacter proteolyticus]|uniref:Uncharacterized protein n=1 Tax=Acinetobacter proteolyticus TaxID=1776741 RepID=A0A653K268_9GAMM|nr:hypothetical protein ACI8B_180305 [Acinetobacter proteolyticus]
MLTKSHKIIEFANLDQKLTKKLVFYKRKKQSVLRNIKQSNW